MKIINSIFLVLILLFMFSCSDSDADSNKNMSDSTLIDTTKIDTVEIIPEIEYQRFTFKFYYISILRNGHPFSYDGKFYYKIEIGGANDTVYYKGGRDPYNSIYRDDKESIDMTEEVTFEVPLNGNDYWILSFEMLDNRDGVGDANTAGFYQMSDEAPFKGWKKYYDGRKASFLLNPKKDYFRPYVSYLFMSMKTDTIISRPIR